MINLKALTKLSEFESLKKGDIVACEFHRDVTYKNKRVRFGVFEIALNRDDTFEIILDRKSNTYFNYKMFIAGESNLKSIVLISQEIEV